MAKATSSRESSSKTEVSVYSDTLADSQNGNIEKRAHRANVARHARKCSICHHEDREFIDQDYLRWLSPKKIAREYQISHHSVVYRHADATGLRTQRRASLRATLENFIEQAESVRATAGSVVAAVRLYAQINDQGQWVPPVRHHIVEHRYVDERSPKDPPAQRASPLKKKDGPSSADSFTATSAAPTGASPEKFGLVPSEREARASQAAGGSPPDRSSPLSSNAAGSPAATSGAQSAAPLAQAPENSDPVRVTGRSQPVATITAGCAVPFGASPEKFPAVPVASIKLATSRPISNREHVELEHAATH